MFASALTAALSVWCGWQPVVGMDNGGVTKRVSGWAVSKIRKGDWIVWRHSLYQFPELIGNFSFLPRCASRGPGRRGPLLLSVMAQGPWWPQQRKSTTAPV